VRHFLELSLRDLQMEYVDLYLIHTPIGRKYVNDRELEPKGPDGTLLYDMTTNLESIWKSMEDQVEAGLARSIGVSNFNSSQVHRILSVARIPLASVQVELHAYYQQKELHNICKDNGISLVAYAPCKHHLNKQDFIKYLKHVALF